MAQKDSSSHYSSQNSDPESKRRSLSGDDLYSAIEEGDDEDAPTASGLWRKQVLTGYKAKKRPTDTHTLLAKIPDGRATYEVGDRHKSVSIQEAMVMIVERMFDAFQNYGYEFNKDATGSELELNWIRPMLSRELNGASVFSGRLSTRRWTMIIKGTPQEVLAFILPADKLIGFSLSATNFKPYFRMLPTSDGLDVRWKVEKSILAPEVFPKVFQDLFVALIKHAQNDSQGLDKFDASHLIPDDVIVEEEDVHKKYRDAFFEDMRQMADTTTADHVPYTSRSHDGRAYDEPARTQDLIIPEDTSYPKGQPNGWPAQPQDSGTGRMMPPYVPPAMPARPTPPPGPPVIQTAAQPGQQVFKNLRATQQQMNQQKPPGQRPDPSFAGALAQMIVTLDRELEIVAKAGADAFANKDLARADAALKFSERLTEFRRNAQELMDYYRRR